MNFIVAILLMYIGLVSGFPIIINENDDYKNAKISNESIIVYDITKGSSSDKNKLPNGSTVLSIDNITFKNVNDISTYISNKSTININVKDTTGEKNIILDKGEDKDFGFVLEKLGTIKYNILAAVPKSFETIWSLTLQTFDGLGYLISNIFAGKGLPNEISGPVGIAVMTGDVVRSGFSQILYFILSLSLSLSIINILPFPALDGGRVLFLLFEKIKGKHLNQKFEVISNFVGFLLLMALVVAVTFKDIFTFIIKK